MRRTSSGFRSASHPTTKKVPVAPCRASSSSSRSVLASTRLGWRSQSARAMKGSKALTWKCSSTSTENRCALGQEPAPGALDLV